MDDNCLRRDSGAVHPRRASAAPDPGSSRSAQDGEALEGFPLRESEAAPARLTAAARRMERRNSATQGSHHRHMPIEPLKMPIPRKTKEKIGKLFGGKAPVLQAEICCNRRVNTPAWSTCQMVDLRVDLMLEMKLKAFCGFESWRLLCVEIGAS